MGCPFSCKSIILLNTFSPGFVANEQVYTFNLELSNDGNMELLVDTSTRLVIRDGSFELSSNLSTEILLERNDTSKTLSFDPILIPNDFSTGVLSPILILSGSMENEENFSDEIIFQESLIIHQKFYLMVSVILLILIQLYKVKPSILMSVEHNSSYDFILNKNLTSITIYSENETLSSAMTGDSLFNMIKITL